MLRLDYNPCPKRRAEWLSRFSPETQKRILEIEDNGKEIPRLIKLKRNRNPVDVHIGDVFLASNREGIYYYGKVIDKIEERKAEWLKNCYVVFIFNCVTTEKNLNAFVPDYESTQKPIILHDAFWKKGYLEIIGNIPLTKEEEDLDIGFFDTFRDCQSGGIFLDSSLKEMNSFPKYFGRLGTATIYGVEAILEEYFVTNS